MAQVQHVACQAQLLGLQFLWLLACTYDDDFGLHMYVCMYVPAPTCSQKNWLPFSDQCILVVLPGIGAQNAVLSLPGLLLGRSVPQLLPECLIFILFA